VSERPMKVNQCGETCERARLCAACSAELIPLAMPTGSPLNDAFLAWWEAADSFGGSVEAACRAAFKAGAIGAVAQPLTEEQIRDIAEDFASSFMHGGTQFDNFDSVGFARAVLSAAPKATQGEPVAYLCPAGCGCTWRDNRNGSMSLLGNNSKSCEVCEPLPLSGLAPVYASAPKAAPQGTWAGPSSTACDDQLRTEGGAA
jgi:hypothetical protein